MQQGKNRLKARLLDYLRRHPSARDTLDGIAKSWLAGELAVVSRQAVEDVVSDLVARGLMERTLKPDGEWIYGLAGDLSEATPEGSGIS